MLKNYMEDMVGNSLSAILGCSKDICTCPQCIDDIKAIALNNLQPLYFASTKGEIYNKLRVLETQFGTDITRELTKAIDIVRENPNHRQE